MIFEKIKKDLEFAIQNKKNVLLIGDHGVGKSSLVTNLFQSYFNGNYRYYSASTMDPWVDFVGCPFKDETESGVEFLNLMRPKDFAEDTVKAICIDEFNRGNDKVQNALMELIQFKSINGKKFNNLDVVWACINPQNGNYKVEELDAAHKDRFHYIITIPSEPDPEYFTGKFGKEITVPAIEWWRNIPEKIKSEVSPRRLEYALEIITLGGDVNMVLPQSSNPHKLMKEIGGGSVLNILKHLLEERNPEKLVEFFNNDNNYFNCKDYVLKKDKELIQYFSEERISELVSTNNDVLEFTLKSLETDEKYVNIINEILNAKQNEDLIKKIQDNILYHDYLLKKQQNNQELIKAEKKLKTYQAGKTDAQIYEYVKKNKITLVGSDAAVTLLYHIQKKDKTTFPDIEEIMHYLMHHGLID